MLNERQRRIYLGSEDKSIGWGGTSKIAQLSSVSRRTIAKEITESAAMGQGFERDHIRKEGGGRKKVAEQQPKLKQAIEDIVSPHTMGDPMNP